MDNPVFRATAQAELAELRKPLHPNERYWRLRKTDPHECELCGAKVYPKGGMWWDWDGTVHNLTCRPRRLRVV